jgi:hypothetical protein
MMAMIRGTEKATVMMMMVPTMTLGERKALDHPADKGEAALRGKVAPLVPKIPPAVVTASSENQIA